MRIVSLLPSATETLFALGLGDQIVAVTHECDFPAEAAALPVVTRSTLALEGVAALVMWIAKRRPAWDPKTAVPLFVYAVVMCVSHIQNPYLPLYWKRYSSMMAAT